MFTPLRTARELYAYRELVYTLTVKDLKVRYRITSLGFLWSIVSPLFLMGLFTVVFSVIIRIEVPRGNFPAFLLCALFPWNWLDRSVNTATGCLVDGANLVKNIAFPREAIPLSVILSNLITFLFSLVLLFVLLPVLKVPVTHHALFLPLIIAIQFVFTLGVSFIVSALYPESRDVGYIMQILMMAWFYLTPIFYPVSMVPAVMQKYLFLNPMASIVTLYRNVLYEQSYPDPMLLGYAGLAAVLILLTGHILFKRRMVLLSDIL